MNTASDLDDSILPSFVHQKIQQGKIAVVPNFLTSEEVRLLQKDAQNLYNNGSFTTDALASYGASGKFDPAKDRAVLKLKQWQNEQLGDWKLRLSFGNKMARVRKELAEKLNRPKLCSGHAVTDLGIGSTEVTKCFYISI